jgi:4-amino-4-deoxy-L-arabinose transferase-like glycosyltransferase
MLAETIPTSSLPTVPQSSSHDGTHIPLWEKILLLGILLLTAGLDFYHIDHNGLGNTYYAVTVRSMSLNWHNWFFASFDPAGFVSVDKTPLGFWIQTLSVKVFGFNGPALILPQALAGILSVWLLYAIVRRVFDGLSALIGALALALSPINVVSNRDNILESLLVACVLAATLAVLVAAERGSLHWLLLAGCLIGLGFTIKMLEAYLVVPALGLAYWLIAPLPWQTRLRHLAAASAVMVVVSFAWVMAVDLTPASSRPYVGSSYHNHEVDLVFAYNGLQRLFGTPWTHPAEADSPTGIPGPFRLLTPGLGGQIAWLLPCALIALLAMALRYGRRMLHARRFASLSPRQGLAILWGVWLITMFVFFSASAFFNAYYLTLLSPALAALTGIGLTRLWSAWSAAHREGWLLLGIIWATAIVQVAIVASQRWHPWLVPAIGLLALLASFGLFAMVMTEELPASIAAILRAFTAIVLAGAIGLAPLLWTLSSLHPDAQSGFPLSGPVTGDSGSIASQSADPRLIAFLLQHAAGATFLAATVDAYGAIPIILATGRPVMAMGGYTGFDPILTPATLAARVGENDVRYFYVPSSNLTPQQRQQIYPNVRNAATKYTNALTQWVAQQCRAVPADQWSETNSLVAAQMNAMQLFDCSQLVSRALGSNPSQPHT